MVLGLGLVVVTASGCVWYLPALADVRAGDDRPVHRRTAALACLTGWATAGIAGLLVLAGAWWPVPVTPAVAGAAATAALRVRAGVQHRREAREAARRWAALEPTPPRHGRGRPRTAVAALVSSGAVAALAVATLLVAAGPENGRDWLVAAALPAAVVGVFLVLAVACAHPQEGSGSFPTRRR
ncbi:hypothetical protein AB0I00_05485 [Streptomyces sp. NPDC050803]|uniref:hypothetical protein n=1 Tax=unclassified Streptomyces TaxID=2593676 RepID=UPI00342E04F9